MPSLLEEINQYQTEGLQEVSQVKSLDELESVRHKWLGRKDGRLKKFENLLPTLSREEKGTVGRQYNMTKVALEGALEQKKRSLEDDQILRSISQGGLDLTLPGFPHVRGGLHPLTQVQEEIVGVFSRLGFSLAEGPEVETDENNFTALNHPPDHPARDAHDTFYLKDFRDEKGLPLLLRTHTSPVQVRYMRSHQPPLYIVAPGRVFRHEAVDATHSFVFHQVEGLAVDQDLSLADLKGVLALFVRHLFGPQAGVRFRPSYFPFVEPGIEVDITCTLCQGKGCRVCKQSGWLEMLGAGLVHPNVFRAVGYDPEKVMGYAFGIGVERVAMFKYGVDDMRLFFENDVRFLRQF
jgi:phenylalanyl-tRNA synthetase alpha chain